MAERQREAGSPYQGAAGQTRTVATHLACRCGVVSTVALPRGVNAATDPALAEQARSGRLHETTCARCGAGHRLDAAFVYHDPEAPRLVLVMPEGSRHRELDERAALWRELADDRAQAVPAYVLDFQVAHGTAELIALLAGPADDRAAALDARAAALDARERELEAREAALGRDTGEHLVPSVTQEDTRVTGLRAVPAADRDLVLDADGVLRWDCQIEHDSGALAAAVGHRQAHLTVQTFLELPAPLVAVSVSAGPLASAPAAAVRTELLDLSLPADLRIVQALATRCALELDLGDGQVRKLDAPLEDNVQLGLRHALERLASRTPAPGAFAAAIEAYQAPDFDRTGKRAASLAADSFASLTDPGELLQALDVIAHWSTPERERYLLLERALPASWWRTCRHHVLERAVVLGLALPPALLGIAVEVGLARSRRELIGRLGRAFASSCESGIALDPARRAGNWKALKAEAASLGVTLEAPARGPVAQEAAPARTASELPGEPTNRSITQASEAELVALLDDRSLRGDAACELARRGQAASLAPVFRALARMTRGDASRLLPLLTSYGAEAVGPLVENLRSKKGFLRHGSALALAVIGHRGGIAPLCAQLVDEPTELWRELARAIGALGPAALPALAGRVREVPFERHERLAWAMAHVAAHEGRGQLEALARGKDSLVSEVARSALALTGEAQKSDAEVRGRAPAAEQTVNRAFSRSFFDAVTPEGREAARLGPRASTLRPGAVEPDEEEILDDADFLPG
jgi:hypothetical protein